ncbi:glycoside hydrolase family 47 protein [Tieghemostelium lacteum]|uniref:alpha-1,2-Mannosidase n=1 Tax=Tieghemostelium lacteum TaxID=361077 RepID=A0A151Z826_TIELA|nr:glycoside hydrolase family 47 protein [Tieghemostelium lacteum]|eukprot:KYQ90097.1 glycoside hydrolase family 47 protein [Tieghemostelium lacteum]
MFSAIFIIGSITILNFDGGVKSDSNPIPKRWRNIKLDAGDNTEDVEKWVNPSVNDNNNNGNGDNNAVHGHGKDKFTPTLHKDTKTAAYGKNGVYYLSEKFADYEEDKNFKVGSLNQIDRIFNEQHIQNQQRRDAIRSGMKFAWDKYVEYAWGHDELRPLSKVGHDWFGLGLTIVDSIDTLYLMGLKDEYKKARDWIANELHQDKNSGHTISVFETNIRFLGGYLATYEMTGDEMFLEKAKEMGHILLKAFVQIFPRTSLNIGSSYSSIPSWTGGCVILSEFGTMFLEFEHLARLTGDKVFYEKSRAMLDHLDNMHKKTPGLYPIYVAEDGSRFCNDQISLGAMGDSFYEYLIKMWIYYDKQEDQWQRMYMESTDSVIKHMYKVSGKGHGYIPNYSNGRSNTNQEHLTCFAGGMFALGAAHNITGNETLNRIHFHIGKEVTKSCAESYIRTGSGLGPEVFGFDSEGEITANGYGAVPWYILRPETAESLFILFRLTGDTLYQDYGWKMWEAIEKHCRVEGGYAGVKDVNTGQQKDDLQQSFFMAETFKYLYLLFSDSSVIPLDKYVFNTEAHPIPVQKAHK